MASGEGPYILAAEEEISRLSSQHDVMKDEAGGLVLAPIDFSITPLRILDSATADGTWIRDLAQEYAAVPHEFVGTDIDPNPLPKEPAAHQMYQVQDNTKPWPPEWKNSFDLVHQRLGIAGSGPNAKQVISSLADMVKPGGWIQLIEAINEHNDSHGPAFRNWITMVRGIHSTFNTSLKLPEEFLEWFKELGFVDVHYRDLEVKFGARNPNPQLAKQSIYAMNVASKGLAHFVSTLPEGAVPLTADQITNNPEEVCAELAKVGAIYLLRAVWARKPSQ